MVPSQLVREVTRSLKSLILSEFPVSSSFFLHDGVSVVQDFLEKPDSITQGPWAQIMLPFAQDPDYANVSDSNAPVPPFQCLRRSDFGRGFPPYAHQVQAFKRLCADEPQSTIVATGTGSGKTECFLFPILDYCLRSSDKGVKAVIVYPMNALANDQAARLASFINTLSAHSTKKIRAGVYTGDRSTDNRTMTPTELITDREVMRNDPPDILLTNYKMLDLLTFRPADQKIWDNSTPGSLKFLVVDELHSFDGAQATDLACLIRRLRERTGKTDKGALACVGTSATIGGPESLEALCDFASKVFAADFPRDSVVLERRLSASNFIENSLEELPDASPLGSYPTALPDPSASPYEDFIFETVRAWFGNELSDIIFSTSPDRLEQLREALPSRLVRLSAFRRLLLDTGGSLFSIRELAQKWADDTSAREMNIGPGDVEQAQNLIDSLLTLVSEARVHGRPFLQLRVQLWARELARMVSTVSAEPELVFSDDCDPDTFRLPFVVCRECGHAGWGGVQINNAKGGYPKLSKDLQTIYRAWFSNSDAAQVLYPIEEKEFFEEHKKEAFLLNTKTRELRSALTKTWEQVASIKNPDGEFQFSSEEILVWRPDFTVLTNKLEQTESEGLFSTVIKEANAQVKRFQNACPFCRRKGSLIIFGWSVSSLVSTAVARINASQFNLDPKILAFSDSVQDAAQIAGYLEARGYRSTAREAIAQYIGKINRAPLPSFVSRISLEWFQRGYEPYRAAVLKKLNALYAKEPNKIPEAEKIIQAAIFTATFMPSDKEWWGAYPDFITTARDDLKSLIDSYPQWSRLFELSKERLGWAVLEDLGELSQSGKSLLRAGKMALEYPLPSISAAADHLVRSITEGAKALVSEPLSAQQKRRLKERAQRFLLSFLNQIRSTGGFSASALDSAVFKNIAESYVRYLDSGNSFQAFNRAYFMPPRGTKMPPPYGVLLSGKKSDRYWPTLSSKQDGAGWYNARMRRFIGDSLADLGFELEPDAYVADFWSWVFDALSSARLLEVKTRKDGTVYAILNAHSLNVTNALQEIRCDVCGKSLKVPATNLVTWIGMPCLSNDCCGHFQLDQDGLLSSDGRLSERLMRLNAKEHTALVSDVDRREYERSFKSGSFPWEINLLSATPTLEMGVDIGALSSVVQCSLPPTVASYLQRIGRAGRRDGNALALSLIGRDNHSLYFWSDPYEMLKGKVEVPGVFLSASAVLERQLFAFALSEWVRDDGSASFARLYEVLKRLRNGTQEGFPYSFFGWIAEGSRREELCARFFALFKGDLNALSGEIKEDLNKYLTVNPEAIEKILLAPGAFKENPQLSLAERLMGVFKEALIGWDNWLSKRKKLSAAIKSLEKQVEDDAVRAARFEYQQAEREISALIRQEIQEKDLIAFLTDRGLLPNYAFPEAGVQVRSVIVRKESSANEKGVRFDKTEETFARPASSAMTELVPPNTFYAYSYRFHVDALQVEQDSFEKWRICPDCMHIEKNASASESTKCPNCGSQGWTDVGSVHQVMRMREVTIRAKADRDKISESDDRRQSLPIRKMLLIEPGGVFVNSRWTAQKKRLFLDIEYLSSVLIREINIGAKDETSSMKSFIAGKELSGNGFTVCRHCGKFRDPLHPNAHEVSCSCFNKDPKELKEDPWVKGLMLYREMTSEAVRIKLPPADNAAGSGADVDAASMVAALNLGLRKYFKGNISHLRTEIQVLPDGIGGMRRYIVIYDTVPGGTGYLKELGSRDPQTGAPTVLMKVLRLAWEAVTTCTCVDDPQKDGCYHCLYQYSNASSRKKISRRAAVKLLKGIVSLKDEEFVPVQKPAQEQREVTLKEKESWLETKFLERLKETPGFSLLNHSSKNGNETYLLTVRLTQAEKTHWEEILGRNIDESLVWRIDTQVDFGRTAEFSSRPDFVISPYSERDAKNHPELVHCVFCDGWEFHKGSVSSDALKRQSLLNLGHRVWSISWEALKNAFPGPEEQPQEPDPAFLKRPAAASLDKLKTVWTKIYHQKAEANGELPQLQEVKTLFKPGETSFSWLTEALRDPTAFGRKAGEFARYRGATRIATGEVVPVADFSINVFNETKPAAVSPGEARFVCAYQDTKKRSEEEGYYVSERYFLSRNLASLVGSNQSGISCALLMNDTAWTTTSRRDDEARNAWQYFFDLSNLLQFSDRVLLATPETLRSPIYDEVFHPTSQEDPKEKIWRELIEEISLDPEYFGALGEMVTELKASEVPYPSMVLVDGWGEETMSKSTGLVWKRAGRELALFPSSDVEDTDHVKSSQGELITEKTPDWIGRIKSFLA